MLDDEHRVARLRRLEPFAGEWRIEAPAFPLAPELVDTPRWGRRDDAPHRPTGRRERAISCRVPGRALGVCGDYEPSFSPDGRWLLVINPYAGFGACGV